MLSKIKKLPQKTILKQQTLTKAFVKQSEVPPTLQVKNSSQNSSLGTGIIPTEIQQLRISSWNVNGLRAVLKRNDLQSYLEKNNPDILCLNETKIDEIAFIQDKIQQQIPEGYHQYWNFCKPPIKGYSGVAILTKYQPLTVKEDIDIEIHSQEGRVLQLEFEKFFLIVVYVPNAGDGLRRLDYRVNQFDKDFQGYINKLKLIKNVIVCGDLNVAHQPIDLKNPQTNGNSPGFTLQERNSFTQWIESGWIDTFRYLYPSKIQYSWWSMRSNARPRGIGWRIDYFIVNKGFEQFVSDSIIQDQVFGSDHCPVQLTIDVKKLYEQIKEDDKCVSPSIQQTQDTTNQENVNNVNKVQRVTRSSSKKKLI